MHNVSIVTKRNMASATVGMCFLVMSIDTFHPRHNTLDSINHTFGFFKGMKRGFDIMECVEIEEKTAQKLSCNVQIRPEMLSQSEKRVSGKDFRFCSGNQRM